MARPPGFYEPLRETHEKVRAEQFTWDDVRNNAWAVVDLPIPRDADTDLLTEARNVVKYYCLDQISRSIECDGARNDPIYPPGYIDERLEKTTGRLAELDGRLAERQQPEHSDDLEARTERALREARAAAKGLTGDIQAAEPAMPGVER